MEPLCRVWIRGDCRLPTFPGLPTPTLMWDWMPTCLTTNCLSKATYLKEDVRVFRQADMMCCFQGKWATTYLQKIWKRMPTEGWKELSLTPGKQAMWILAYQPTGPSLDLKL